MRYRRKSIGEDKSEKENTKPMGRVKMIAKEKRVRWPLEPKPRFDEVYERGLANMDDRDFYLAQVDNMKRRQPFGCFGLVIGGGIILALLYGLAMLAWVIERMV